MNCILKDATRTDAKGNKTAVEHIFLRGSQIAFFVFPNMLKKAPMFKRVRDWKRNNWRTKSVTSRPSAHRAAVPRDLEEELSRSRAGVAIQVFGGTSYPALRASSGGRPPAARVGQS